jgi:hypothetical protein
MPENPDCQSFGRSLGSPLRNWLNNSEKWTSFLIALAVRHSRKRRAPDVPKSGTVLSPAKADAAPNYLGRCSEQALDAYTVEDAIFWHCEIIGELAVQIHETQSKLWPASAKATVIEALRERQQDHGRAVARLYGIVRRNEQLIWQPGGVD